MRARTHRSPRTILALTLVLALPATRAHAFCGFYVGGDDSSLRNDATMVVLMREGTTTVLSMRNAYAGPPEDFALVVPVPTLIGEDNVRTLPAAVFQAVDRLAAPRLVEYWERDPCHRPTEHSIDDLLAAASGPNMSVSMRGARSSDLGVTVEAEFAVGEYDIVILGAEDSIGLDTWLRREGYHLPASAARALRPYVAQGTKFFVAKVDVARVRFDEGRALLSPLRVHYQSEEFSLPIRLGLLNSPGTQDLIVHILSPDGRYETANYPNVFIPTNLEVDDGVRDHFGRFYASLFERVRRQHPDAVVTEYAWGARSCDPCPDGSYGLQPNHLYLLGADQSREFRRTRSRPDPRARRMRRSFGRGHILTRLHYRYDRGGADRDLVFRRAAPVVGGRGTPNQRARMPRDVRYASTNAFQARYAILHRWQGPIRCAAPRRGLWGGPAARGIPAARPALNLSQRRPTRRLAPFFPNSSVPPLRTRPWSAEEN